MTKKHQHKDPLRYKAIENYENSFKENFSLALKLSVVEISKNLKKLNDSNTKSNT